MGELKLHVLYTALKIIVNLQSRELKLHGIYTALKIIVNLESREWEN